MKKNIVLFLCLLLTSIIFVLINFNNKELVIIRLERHGALDLEYIFLLSKSGKLDLYVSEKNIGSSNIKDWIEQGAKHYESEISSAELSEIKKLTREIYWTEWFSYDGHRIEDDIEGYWYRIVLIDGKKYTFYNYPYTSNKLNQLVNKIVGLSTPKIEIDEYGNVEMPNKSY